MLRNPILFVVSIAATTIATANIDAASDGKDAGSWYYNEFFGNTSDGAAVVGAGWFQLGAETGGFCLQTGDIACSGEYPANADLFIEGELSCTDGTTGNFAVRRAPYGHLVKPVIGFAVLSDGRTGEVEFGPVLPGKVDTACHAVSEDGMV